MANIKTRTKQDPPPILKGRIISDRNGVQAIMTDSKEEGKRLIHCLGFTRIDHATTGNKVELRYEVIYKNGVPMTGVWKGRRVE